MGRNRTCLRVKGMGSTRSLLTVFAAGVLMVAPPCTGAARASSSDYELAWIEDFLEGVGRVDWSADGVWIAFDHREPGDYFDVYRIRADRTGGVECLTCDHPYLPNLQQGNPAYHPGGRWLLFQAAKKDCLEAPGITNPGRGAYNDLWVMDLESTPPYDVYPLTDVSPDDPPGGSLHAHFSRDGTRLLWGDLQGAAECYGDWRIAVASFVPTPFPHLDMETIQYYEPGDEMQWYEVQDWSPDDSCIYFSAAPLAGQDDRGQDFCYMDLSSGALTRLTETSGRNGEEKEWDEHGKLTPRGDAIVWMTSEDYGTIPDDTCNHVANLNTDLWIMNPDGSEKIKLTRYNDPLSPDYVEGGVCVSDHSWNPDGTKLAVEVFFRRTPRADLKIFHFDLADPSATPSPSPTASATVTSTKTPTNTPTSTHTMSPTSTPTAGASGTPTPTPTKTATPTPTSLSFTLRFTFQPYGAETPPDSMKDWGQSYGDDEEAGDVPGSGIEIEYGWL